MKPDKILKTFKTVLTEAAETFGVPPYKVTLTQFHFISKGRLPIEQLRLFGYVKLRNHVAPSPGVQIDRGFKELLERISKKAVA